MLPGMHRHASGPPGLQGFVAGESKYSPGLPGMLPLEGAGGNSAPGLRRKGLCGPQAGLCRQRPAHATAFPGPGSPAPAQGTREGQTLSHRCPPTPSHSGGRKVSLPVSAPGPRGSPEACGRGCNDPAVPVGSDPTDALLSSIHSQFLDFHNKSDLLNVQQNAFSVSVCGNSKPSVAQTKTLEWSLCLFS